MKNNFLILLILISTYHFKASAQNQPKTNQGMMVVRKNETIENKPDSMNLQPTIPLKGLSSPFSFRRNKKRSKSEYDSIITDPKKMPLAF